MGIAYIGWHVWTLVPLPAVWRVSIIMAGVLSFLMIFLNFRRAIDDMPLPLARLVYDIGNSSVFILLYLVVIFLVLDLGRLLHLVRPQWMHQNFPLTACIVIGMFALFLYGNVHYHHKVREELHLTTDKPLARPLRIVMLSDLHLGYHNPRKELARWVDLINAENPDVVLIAGDVIDMSMRLPGQSRVLQQRTAGRAVLPRCPHPIAARHLPGSGRPVHHGTRRPHQPAAAQRRRAGKDGRPHKIHHPSRPPALSSGRGRAGGC